MAREQMIELARPAGAEPDITIYVKGFLARGEEPDHFKTWHDGHRRLSASHGWGSGVYGYCWPSGRFGGLPLPLFGTAKTIFDLVRAARRAGRASPAGALGLMAVEHLVRLTARFVSQYRAATRAARERAEQLARHLEVLSARHERVRVVAHSLGCLQVIEAVALLDRPRRPGEIHLCAPACQEEEVAGHLAGLARGPSVLYFARNDLVLETAFRVMSRGRALGAVGPSASYPDLEALDVGDHFGFWVHHEYKRRFPEFAARYSEPPTVP